MSNEECNKALLRLVPKINMNTITSIFNEVPAEYNGLSILSEVQKDYYLKVLKYRYDNILVPIYNKLNDANEKM